MSEPSDEVGYGHPPKRTRWVKGQSGNPRREPNKSKRSDHSVIDNLLAKKISAEKKSNYPADITALQVIVRQLYAKTLAGDKQALQVLLKYTTIDPEIIEREIIVMGGLPERPL